MISRKQEIQDAFNELPENIKEAVENFDWSKEILAIAQKYSLQIDDVDVFRQETMLVIVGLERASNYKSNLVEKMNISDELAEELVYESNTRIFKELQRRAFSNEQHGVITNAMKEEGVHLIDEKVKNEKRVPMYHEPISEDDYRGVSGHRINTDFIVKNENQRESQSLEKTLYTDSTLTRGDSITIAKDEVKKDNGEFLNHLKNTS